MDDYLYVQIRFRSVEKRIVKAFYTSEFTVKMHNCEFKQEKTVRTACKCLDEKVQFVFGTKMTQCVLLQFIHISALAYVKICERILLVRRR